MAALPAEFTAVDYGHWLSVSATHWSSGSPIYKYMLSKAWQFFDSGFVCSGTALGPECMRDTLPPSFGSALKPSNYLLSGWMQECGGGDIGDGGHLKMSFAGADHYN